MSIGMQLTERASNFALAVAQAENEVANDVWEGWGSVMLVVGGMVLTFGLVAMIIWQVFRTRRVTLENRAMIAHDEAYRRLAEEATSVQNRTAAELHQLTEGMADLRVRVTTIERMLREVE